MKKNNNDFDFIAGKFRDENITAPETLSENAVLDKLDRKELPKRRLNTKSGGRLQVRRAIALAACFAIFVTAGFSARAVKTANEPKPLVTANGTISGISSFTSYRQLKNTVGDINKKNERSYTTFGGVFDIFGFSSKSNSYVEDSASVTAANDAEYGTDTVTKAAENYGETNRQVDAVDEADILKTDGNYIYYLRPGDYDDENGTWRVMIFKADGIKTERVSEIALPEYIAGQETTGEEMFLCGDRLAVIATYPCHDWSTFDPIDDDDIIVYEKNEEAETDVYEETTDFEEESTVVIDEPTGITEEKTETSEPASEDETETSEPEPDTAEAETASDTTVTEPEETEYDGYATSLLIYNVSDRNKPFLEARYNQSGYYNTARRLDNCIYLVTQHYGYDYYVPLCGCDTEMENVPIENVAAVDGCNTTDYAVIGAVNIESGENTQTHALLGVGSNLYCNENNLYLAGNIYEYENGYFNYSYNTHTQLAKYTLDNAEITLAASATVDGITNDQFSLDEKDGKLRIATTSTGSDFQDTNNLFVLDGDLKEVGKVTGFANNEHIKAVRFLGDTAYVITFEQTDPLFVIDLSDPAAPKITGEVKLDGFSSQLTPVDEHTLLGIGWGGYMNANLKLVLFDIADKENPQVLQEAVFPEAISNAQYSHKALLINREDGYFAIPIDHNNDSHYYLEDGSVVYGSFPYEIGVLKFTVENGGFRFENYATGYRDTRCTYIGDYLYAIGSDDSGRGGSDSYHIKSFNMKDRSQAHTVSLPAENKKSFDFSAQDVASVIVMDADGNSNTLTAPQTEQFLALLGEMELGDEDYNSEYAMDGYYIKGITFTIQRRDGFETTVMCDGEACTVDGYALYPVHNPEVCSRIVAFGESALNP